MPKTQKKQSKNGLTNLHLIIAGLTVICLLLVLALVQQCTTQPAQPKPSISLGAMQYDFSSSKAVKRTDASITALAAFLQKEADQSGCKKSSPAYEHVVAYTQNEDQVLLKYGCGAADSPMFAVKKAGVWRGISPTNHFDTFDIPVCAYLTKYAISRQIAPVCLVDMHAQAASYRVR